MKRLVIGLSIIILLGMLAYCIPIYAQPTQIPHVDPTIATESLEKAELLVAYSNLFNLAAERQYQDAHDFLERLKVSEIPKEFQYIINRYNELSQELFTTLNNTELLLKDASDFFSENKFSNAQEKLDEARVAIHEAQLLLADIETITNALRERLGISPDSATGKLKNAYDRLKRSLQLLGELTDELNKLRLRLIENPIMAIETKFYHVTLLEISAPDTVYPGLPFAITGQVSSTGDNIDRTIEILLDDTGLSRETVKGTFRFQFTAPQDIPTGEHILTVAAIRQGLYSGVAKSTTIKVLKLPIRTEIRLPKLAMMPMPIQITGIVYHGLYPLQDAGVSLEFKDSVSITRTDTNGSFVATVKPSPLTVTTATSVNPLYTATTTQEFPIDFSLIGWQTITLTVSPAEPWYTTLKIQRQVLTINPLNTSLLLALLVSLGLVIYRRGRIRPEEKHILKPQLVDASSTIPPLAHHKPYLKTTGIKDRILSSYQSGLKSVEKARGITMLPHTTLREFLKVASPLLATAMQPFTELTILAEAALYSLHQLDEDTASRAEQLAASIRKELSDGTP